MMRQVLLKLNEPQVKALVDQLNIAAKERLLKNLERTVHKSEWETLFHAIDQRRKVRRVPSMKEIVKEVKAVRRELYERSQRGH